MSWTLSALTLKALLTECALALTLLQAPGQERITSLFMNSQQIGHKVVRPDHFVTVIWFVKPSNGTRLRTSLFLPLLTSLWNSLKALAVALSTLVSKAWLLIGSGLTLLMKRILRSPWSSERQGVLMNLLKRKPKEQKHEHLWYYFNQNGRAYRVCELCYDHIERN